ncbi:hypothetical protein JYK02_37400 [Corallococcus macrosporus]|uniref:Uncharacterized protein n=1 Tax=Corallococcus macrosporus TaxID=35 RepID=A0ABS3DPF7_9BACT|nr:hypothetical protein [Corallococcus macrosporus]MBN8233206.1 hypothetical protein [Corallococcus macrosporus]
MPSPAPTPRRVIFKGLAAVLGLLTVALLAHAGIRWQEADPASHSRRMGRCAEGETCVERRLFASDQPAVAMGRL